MQFTQLLKLNLEQTGAYEVRTESLPEQALAAARAFRPDLIFLDVIMPQMQGGEVAAQLRADPALKDTPVAFLTAVLSEEEAARRQHLIGGNPFLAKPVHVEDVIACIEQRLRR